jgi:hypothetical protein
MQASSGPAPASAVERLRAQAGQTTPSRDVAALRAGTTIRPWAAFLPGVWVTVPGGIDQLRAPLAVRAVDPSRSPSG